MNPENIPGYDYARSPVSLEELVNFDPSGVIFNPIVNYPIDRTWTE